jgi:hypothetical protein
MNHVWDMYSKLWQELHWTNKSLRGESISLIRGIPQERETRYPNPPRHGKNSFYFSAMKLDE